MTIKHLPLQNEITMSKIRDYRLSMIGRGLHGLTHMKWTSNQPKRYKINLIKCSAYRAVRICSSDILLKTELDYCRKTFTANGYPQNVINKALRRFKLNKTQNSNKQRNLGDTIFISMTYYNEYSMILANRIKTLLALPMKKVRFDFKSQNKLNTIFNNIYKEKNESKQVIYQYDCMDCEGTYIGETSRGIEKRKVEHQNAFKGTGYSKIAEHCSENKHQNNWNYKILNVETNNLKMKINESLLMDMVQEESNRKIYSQKSYELNVFE